MHRLGGRARLKCPDVFGELRRDAGDECVLVYSGRPRGHRLVGALNGISGQGRGQLRSSVQAHTVTEV